jgi:hypothetical protein
MLAKLLQNESLGKRAWIQDPKTANTARFHWDPKSRYADPMYFVDSGRPLTGHHHCSRPAVTCAVMTPESSGASFKTRGGKRWNPRAVTARKDDVSAADQAAMANVSG